MALAYLVLAHRSPAQVARLCGRLAEHGDSVYVHVDRKVDARPFSASFATLPMPPQLVTQRVACHWGGIGHVLASLAAMRQALESGADPSHLILLTGQDYPIRSMAEVQDHFAEHPESSFLSWSAGEGRPVADAERAGNARWLWEGRTNRLLQRHVRVAGRWRAIPPRLERLLPPRTLPSGLVPHQGLAYWNLSIEAARYVLDELDRRPEILRFFRRTLIPDENLFQMVLLASPLRARLVNEDLRFIQWDGWHPRVLRREDVGDMQTSAKLFARKFDVQIDENVLDVLDLATSAATRKAPGRS